jgi:pseudouridine-5'-phosphate glycosidase
MQSAVLVVNPIPKTEALSQSEMERHIEQASKEAKEKKIHGQALTPFLLQRISELTRGESMRANLALLLNNARLAAQIAKALRAVEKRRTV